MGAAITGKDGTVSLGGSAVAHVRKFTLNEHSDDKPYTDSSTSGWAESAEGNKSWDGSIDIYLDAGAYFSHVAKGAKVACVFNTGVDTKTGNCRITDIDSVEVDVEGSGMVSCTLTVLGHGALA